MVHALVEDLRHKTGVLGKLTSYEQISAFASWMRTNGANIQKQHTFSLLAYDASGNKKIVPIWVKKPKNSPATLFTTMVGTTRGKLKAPPYQTWAEVDPKETDLSHFIDPLFCLEAQRQPFFLASTLLRANPYDAGLLDSAWRYKTKNANGTLAQEGSRNTKSNILVK